MMIINRIKKIVNQYPDRIAYKVNDESLTYKELWDNAKHNAVLLQKQGTSPVVIYGHKEINVIKSILACIIANRTYVPIGSCTPVSRLNKIIEMTKASIVITDEIIDLKGVECCKIDDLSKYDSYTVNSINNDLMYIIFTSGSTGEPKGVPISKSNLNNFIQWISDLYPLNTYKHINVLNQASFSFDLSVADLYYSLCNGHTLFALEKDIQSDFDEVFSLMKNIDVAVMTPTLMKICLLNADFNADNYPQFKCVYFCGETLENKTAQKCLNAFPDLHIINAYGPTEATSAISSINITQQILDKENILPVGDMNKLATTVEIINDEIVLKGPSVFSGYLGNVDSGYYQEDGMNCYRTGDLGYIQNNRLYCKGRKDNQVKYKGYRIELNDIEANIIGIQGVISCAVIAKYNNDHIVKTIKAFVTGEVDSNYIKNELAKKIPGYMMPKSIKIMDTLPINSNGKIDRKVLGEL